VANAYKEVSGKADLHNRDVKHYWVEKHVQKFKKLGSQTVSKISYSTVREFESQSTLE
jgi:hypothetical protein